MPLTGDWAPRSWQTEFMRELQARPPVYFVAPRTEGNSGITGHALNSVDSMAFFPVLRQWLASHYEYEAQMNGYVVFRRRE